MRDRIGSSTDIRHEQKAAISPPKRKEGAGGIGMKGPTIRQMPMDGVAWREAGGSTSVAVYIGFFNRRALIGVDRNFQNSQTRF